MGKKVVNEEKFFSSTAANSFMSCRSSPNPTVSILKPLPDHSNTVNETGLVRSVVVVGMTATAERADAES